MKSQKVNLLYSVFLLIFISACSEKDFPKYSALDRLRVLALVVDQPELQNPAAGVVNINLDPYISDIGGTGDITLTIQSCLDPGVAAGLSPNCTNAQLASATQTVIMSSTAGAPLGTFGNPERTGKSQGGAVVVPLQIPANILASYNSAIQLNGIAFLITVVASRGADNITAFRRILISNKTPNTNPVLTDLFSNGVSLTALPSSDVDLTFTTSSAPENYFFQSTTGQQFTLTEVLETNWFASEGILKSSRAFLGEAVKWTSISGPTGRQSIVAGVLRDGRGGVSVVIKKL